LPTSERLLVRHSEERRLHVELAKFRHAASQLEICLHALEDTHVREANLADELELRVFAEGWNRLCDLEHAADDVVRGVAKGPGIRLAYWSSSPIATDTYQRSLRMSSASSTFVS
jgi:hypothetical protein